MSLMTIDQLDMAVPMARYEDLVKYIDFLDEGMERFEINTPNRIAAFIAQVAHESGDFRYTEENLNYSWMGLRKTWPGKFPTDELAQQYHRQPERIANLVYAGRYGNGGEASGDGWKYRGRGLIQLTFHDNYLAYSGACPTRPSLVRLRLSPSSATPPCQRAGSGKATASTRLPMRETRSASTRSASRSTAGGTARKTGWRTGRRPGQSCWHDLRETRAARD